MAVLPEYLKEQTETAIRQRMLGSLPADLDKTEGSYIWDSLSPAAIELALAAIWGREVLRRGFAGTTFGGYLDLRCEEHGLTRKAAEKAAGTVRFAGTVGTVAAAGTRVATAADPVTGASSLEFVTLEEATIGESGTAEAAAEALVAGKTGNVAAGAITLLLTPIAGITSVVNPAAMSGGLDVEADGDLLVRYYAKVRNPSAGGNAADYVNWALSVPGVGGAKTYPLWDGNGTVKVVVVDVDKQPASSGLVAETAAYIETMRPVGADVTVVSAAAVAIDIAAAITPAAGYTLQQITDALREAVVAHFRQIAFAVTSVSIAKIGALLIATPGVLDYEDLTLNGGTGNVDLGDNDIPVAEDIALEV
ncbi:baseplate J/gp47 family protein [Paenibacillus cymbidii]|uniref:baseplate J/gp47 family protein n=1 Tax=Paenibacillus cymbidii TaxID=1639034 RepID=UPI0010819126|nr:baseplate J/gp47 family protein [Paenibacillus cymbidii]